MQRKVQELRLVVTANDYEEALQFYRDFLGLEEQAAFTSEGGHVVILKAGKATLELADSRQAEFIDEREVGQRVAGHIRVAFKVDDSADVTKSLELAGDARVLAEPRTTPWNSLNEWLAGAMGLEPRDLCQIHSTLKRSASACIRQRNVRRPASSLPWL